MYLIYNTNDFFQIKAYLLHKNAFPKNTGDGFVVYGV